MKHKNASLLRSFFFPFFFFVMQPRDPDRLLFYRSARLRGGVSDTSPLILWKLATLIKAVILIIYLKEKRRFSQLSNHVCYVCVAAVAPFPLTPYIIASFLHIITEIILKGIIVNL